MEEFKQVSQPLEKISFTFLKLLLKLIFFLTVLPNIFVSSAFFFLCVGCVTAHYYHTIVLTSNQPLKVVFRVRGWTAIIRSQNQDQIWGETTYPCQQTSESHSLLPLEQHPTEPQDKSVTQKHLSTYAPLWIVEDLFLLCPERKKLQANV